MLATTCVTFISYKRLVSYYVYVKIPINTFGGRKDIISLLIPTSSEFFVVEENYIQKFSLVET